MIHSLILLTGLIIYSILVTIALKRRTNINYDLKRGIVCYSCKEEIDDRYRWEKGTHYRMCVHCKRERGLKSFLTSGFFIDKKILISSKFTLIGIWFNIASVIINAIYVFTKIYPLTITASAFLFTGLIISYINLLAVTKPKND